jgi:hypothetical protein
VRIGRWPVHLRAGGCALVGSVDLGLLLRRVARVLAWDGLRPAVFDAERLIAWRTLRIVVGAPYLPDLARLRVLYPGLRLDHGRIDLPLGLDGAEGALGACAASGVPVAGSWIEYRGAGSG